MPINARICMTGMLGAHFSPKRVRTNSEARTAIPMKTGKASKLVYCVMNAEFERAARAPDADWSRYYAEHFAERFAPTRTATADKLSLYHFPSCPFCVLVRSAIDQLGLDVDLRDIHEDSEHREALIAERGRATVPVLQIESPDGDRRWMPESRDIVRYLNSTYG